MSSASSERKGSVSAGGAEAEDPEMSAPRHGAKYVRTLGLVLLASAFVVAGWYASAMRQVAAPVHIDASAGRPRAIAPLSRDMRHAALYVCADPNNMPFSNARREGFENRIAEILAHDLGRKLEYTWWPERRGFLRNTLGAGKCDVVIGVPADSSRTANTRPYYRSTYVFVTRRDRHLHLTSLDDPRLRRLRIGIHVIGDDYANVPPAEALARRGIIRNVRGYTIYGDYSRPDPPRALIDAVAHGDVDVAVAWGPLAGYFGSRAPVALEVAPVAAVEAEVPMTFAIAVGVRRDDATLQTALDRALLARRGDIEGVLAQYRVPRVSMPAPADRREIGG